MDLGHGGANVTLIDLGDGLLIDESTGEIVDLPPGTDAALAISRRVLAAQDQEKAWAAVKGAGKAALERLLPRDQRRMQCGEESVVRWVNGRLTEQQDIDGMKLELASAELTIAERDALVLAAKGFDLADLPDELREVLAPFVSTKEGKGFVIVEKVRKLAPGTAR